MRKFVLFAAILSAWVVVPLSLAGEVEIPDWAYPVNPTVSAIIRSSYDAAGASALPQLMHAA